MYLPSNNTCIVFPANMSLSSHIFDVFSRGFDTTNLLRGCLVQRLHQPPVCGVAKVCGGGYDRRTCGAYLYCKSWRLPHFKAEPNTSLCSVARRLGRRCVATIQTGPKNSLISFIMIHISFSSNLIGNCYSLRGDYSVIILTFLLIV
jgi:hypothetical protein